MLAPGFSGSEDVTPGRRFLCHQPHSENYGCNVFLVHTLQTVSQPPLEEEYDSGSVCLSPGTLRGFCLHLVFFRLCSRHLVLLSSTSLLH